MMAEQEGSGAGPGSGGQPSEEEIRRQIEEEVRNVRVQDVLLQSVVSLINLSARRIAKEDERDLEQARVGIEAVRAVTDLLDEESASQVRNALTELQMLYAREVEGGKEAKADEAQDEGGEEAPEPEQQPPPQGREPPGGPSKLWTPPGS